MAKIRLVARIKWPRFSLWDWVNIRKQLYAGKGFKYEGMNNKA